jgi:hypothetical protein
MNAWDVFQSYQGMPWEDSKDIDIIYWRSKWWNDSSSLYNAIVLDRPDVLIAKWIYKKRWSLWKSMDRYNADSGNMAYKESTFARIYNSFWDTIPSWLKELAILLWDEQFDPDKISAQAKILREAIFTKPEGFDDTMKYIEENPGIFSESYKEYEFQPTLLFGQGRTWPYWIYPQDYTLPIWLIFAHMYLNMAGMIPYRLWEKFIKKYIPDADTHDINTILASLADRIDGKTIVKPWTTLYEQQINAIYTKYTTNRSDSNDQDDQKISPEDEAILDWLNRKANNCNLFAKRIMEIYQWPYIELFDCIGYDANPSRIGIEIEQTWWLNIYFPINQSGFYEWKIDAIYFSSKEVSTMYLAMLWSPILDSMSDVTRRLTSSK